MPEKKAKAAKTATKAKFEQPKPEQPQPEPMPAPKPSEPQLAKISDLVQDDRNANKGTKRGREFVARSLKEYGAGRSILLDRKGRIIAGNKTVEQAGAAGLQDVVIVPCDGTKLVAVQRTDLDLNDPKARELALADNRAAELGLEWDPKVLHDLSAELDLKPFFSEQEQRAMFGREHAGGGGGLSEAYKARFSVAESLAEFAPTEEEMAVLKGRKVLVEFSGGKDSSAATLWVHHFLPEAEVILMYADLGSEFPTMPQHLIASRDFFGSRFTLKILRSKVTIYEELDKQGWPSPHFPWCHEILHETLDNFVAGFKAEEVVIVRGGRASERSRLHGKVQESRFLVVERMKDYKFFQPLYFSQKEICEKLIADAQMPLWEGYGRGLCRTACRICPGQRTEAYAATRANFPDTWSELVWWESRLGPGTWQSGGPSGSEKKDFTRMANSGEQRFRDHQAAHSNATAPQADAEQQ